MEKVYVNPSVKLINSTNGHVGFFLWLKSRQEIIKDMNGFNFMKEAELNPNWFYAIPNKFIVGDEVVDKTEYYERIDTMNLQYNNGEYLLFEINGSCLFRDMCYNINTATQWAESNRFLFSILDENARFDWKNYKISGEYRGIKEWEDQFETYMDEIRRDPIVDHNRREMPYSISSRFWFGMTRMSLVYFLGFLKHHAPFFFDIYGRKLMEQSDIEDHQLSPEINPLISQYILDENDVDGECVEVVHNTAFVTTKMGLILYSQFIRQSGSVIQGLFNLMSHKDVDSFKHKVFKGDTVFMIRYRADYDKLMKTVKNRLCAFAMSSGNDPCSWSYFLNNFIPEKIHPTQLMSMLPCTFHNDKLCNCKFYDDIKFRNEGKEISNCPCPLVTLSKTDALNKKQRDNNRIGDAFEDLTFYLRNGGFTNSYEDRVWTSNLVIKTDKPFTVNIIQRIQDQIRLLESKYDKFKSNKPELEYNHPLFMWEKYAHNGDYTCMMKGNLIDFICQTLSGAGYSKFLINFGGDIFGCNCTADIHIDGTKFNISKSGYFSVFTSGNTSKRGNHIDGGVPGSQVTVIVDWDMSYLNVPNNTLVDILATKLLAGEDCVQELIDKLKNEGAIVDHLHFACDKLVNSTYCASPFFNETQIEIRDKMVSQFLNVFRPDLTDSESEYNGDHNNNDVVEKVVLDNIRGIDTTEYLVFPNRTTDLGTLFEVGVAIASGHPVIKYDEINDLYTYITPTFDSNTVDKSKDYIFDCSKKSDVIALGAVSCFTDKSKIYYQLKGCPDNIMLSVYYTHVELIGKDYKIIKRDPNERDK